jgi:hypothetical protein
MADLNFGVFDGRFEVADSAGAGLYRRLSWRFSYLRLIVQ